MFTILDSIFWFLNTTGLGPLAVVVVFLVFGTGLGNFVGRMFRG